MRLRVAIGGAIVIGLVVIAACGDLFHSTNNDTVCTLDASTPICPHVPITDLCAADPASALQRAERACAVLAACETPMGQNRTGVCIANALMAYDCKANPNRPPRANAAQFWLALANAYDCKGVALAAAPDGLQGCATPPPATNPFTGCGVDKKNTNSRVQCDGVSAAAGYENCSASGKTCSATPIPANDLSMCVGTEARSCMGTRCKGQSLVICDDAGIDNGIDCSQVGAGLCITPDAGPACKPLDAGTSPNPSTNIVCATSDTASATISGYLESVDCKVFTGVVDGGKTATTCVTIDGGVGTTPRDACQGQACTDDKCASTTVLRACVQGNEVNVDCTAFGLSRCDPSVKTVRDGTHAACAL